MGSKSGSTNSKAELNRLFELCVAFKDKVERDSPSCFVPSRELKAIFQFIEDSQGGSDEAFG